MEIVETCHSNAFKPCVPCPTAECSRRYVQPPRIESFAPKKVYCGPAEPLDSRTTYLSSYLMDDARRARRKPILPCNAIKIESSKFANETATKLSYQPIEGIHKAKPIIPRRRPNMFCGPMENVTTARQDYQTKTCKKLDPIIPCGNICTSKEPLEVTTTTNMSYMTPEAIEQVPNFRPLKMYVKPEVPIPKDTTQKMSYKPFTLSPKEKYPWAQKPVYRPPSEKMQELTTYLTSYYGSEDIPKQGMIMPRLACLFPSDGKEVHSSIYKESYIPCPTEMVEPIIPCTNLKPSSDKMEDSTTTKLSYQAVQGDKRKAIIPRKRHLIGDSNVALEQLTVNRLEYTKKFAPPPQPIVPCRNICIKDEPLETNTTTSMSFSNPGPQPITESFRPMKVYCRPTEKLESDTINHLSFQAWQLGPREKVPWKPKSFYCPPQVKMVDDTIYRDSYPAPGHYVEVCDPVESETARGRVL